MHAGHGLLAETAGGPGDVSVSTADDSDHGLHSGQADFQRLLLHEG